jgi:tripartite ATP-independent transporter DctM subunit
MGNELFVFGLIGSFLVLMLMGIPVAIALAVSGFVFGYWGFGSTLLSLMPARLYGVVTNYTMLAIPLFVFMGVMLEKSNVAQDMLDTIGRAMGGLNGGMGIAIVLVGVLMGASTGIVGATVVTVAMLTLPTLMRRGYKNSISCGTICASGTLGQIIPPSLVLILLSEIVGESVGTLFAAAFIPGLVLAAVYVIYLLGLGMVKPDWVPAIPKEERDAMPAGTLLKDLLRTVVPPLLLVVAVLGSIIGGIAAPTEAASMGALGSMLIALGARRFNGKLLKETLHGTLTISAMVFFILLCASRSRWPSAAWAARAWCTTCSAWCQVEKPAPCCSSCCCCSFWASSWSGSRFPTLRCPCSCPCFWATAPTWSGWRCWWP